MYSAPAIKKAVRILKLIVKRDRPLNVTEISRYLSISKSTAYGILKALEEEQLVLKDKRSKRYVVGKGLMELSKKVFKWLELTMIARPIIEEFVRKVDETTFLGIKEGEKIRVIDVVEAHKELKVSPKIDTFFPITASAFLKLYLSRYEVEEIRSMVKDMKMPKYTENTIVDSDLLIDEILKTKERGFSVDLEEYIKGIRACATLVPNAGGSFVTVCTLGFANSLDDEKLKNLGEDLKTLATSISERIHFLIGRL